MKTNIIAEISKFLQKELDNKCNAPARQAVYEKFGFLPEHKLTWSDWAMILDYARIVGGARPGDEYGYIDARGEVATAQVYDLYNIPKGLKNPFLVCFSGFMTAHLYTFEALRWHYKVTGELLRIFCTGKEGNKGLYKKVVERLKGLMIGSEAEAYLRCLSLLGDEKFMWQYERAVADTDTRGNIDEMYAMAKSLGLKEATFLLVSGNPTYDKRLLAEGMLQLRDKKYADVKINLCIVHCPPRYDFAVPEGHLTEILLGYYAASLGPLAKDTTPLSLSLKPREGAERYALPGLEDADWSIFRTLISDYSNMGWPNYQELLYGVPHEEAVLNIILSDLRARSCFTSESYDEALLQDIRTYQKFLGGAYIQGENFEEYLDMSPYVPYFRR